MLYVQLFGKTRRISEETLQETPDPPREQVRSILDDHELMAASGTAGAVIGGGLGFGMGMFLLITGLLGLVLGLLLRLRKKVWRCKGCGAVLDRA